MIFEKKKIIIGTGNFAFNYGFKDNPAAIDSQEVLKIRKLCNTYGIDKIDTSMDYGASEKIIGKTLNGYDVTTKIQYLSGTQDYI